MSQNSMENTNLSESEPNHRSYADFNQFNTIYMRENVKRIAEQFQCEFSIDEYLPLQLKMAVCQCCLCKLRQKKHSSIEINGKFCIYNDPLKRKCNECHMRKRKSNQQTSKELCNTCMSILVVLSKKNQQTKEIRCAFSPCLYKTTRTASLKMHYLNHLNIKNYACPMCDRGFSTKSACRKHQQIHAKRK